MNKEFIVGTESQKSVNNVYRCPVCEKEFYVGNAYKSNYNYKKINRNGKVRYCCSYGCLNKMKDIILHSAKYKAK